MVSLRSEAGFYTRSTNSVGFTAIADVLICPSGGFNSKTAGI
jgi:hypothetical protein